jgi:hypothetical protein
VLLHVLLHVLLLLHQVGDASRMMSLAPLQGIEDRNLLISSAAADVLLLLLHVLLLLPGWRRIHGDEPGAPAGRGGQELAGGKLAGAHGKGLQPGTGVLLNTQLYINIARWLGFS